LEFEQIKHSTSARSKMPGFLIGKLPGAENKTIPREGEFALPGSSKTTFAQKNYDNTVPKIDNDDNNMMMVIGAGLVAAAAGLAFYFYKKSQGEN
jgi:hypothetical protein